MLGAVYHSCTALHAVCCFCALIPTPIRPIVVFSTSPMLHLRSFHVTGLIGVWRSDLFAIGAWLRENRTCSSAKPQSEIRRIVALRQNSSSATVDADNRS